MRKYCTVFMAASAMAISMLPVIMGCAEPTVDAPLQIEAESLDGPTGQTPPSPAESAEQPLANAAAEATQQPAKKSVVRSLLRAVTKGAAEALDEESPPHPQPAAESPARD